MGRLTTSVIVPTTGEIMGYLPNPGVSERSIKNKLGRYEDLEELGLLLRLPCKVGDTFWELNHVNSQPHIYPRIAHTLSRVVYCMERLGSVTFLTKEEAEAALEMMKGE